MPGRSAPVLTLKVHFAPLMHPTTDLHFPMIPEMPEGERRQFWRRAAIAPLCLLLVAGLHAARVWTARQTPWKGGGFGMFSTIDSERNRFLRAYLVTDSGDLPLALPAALDKPALEQQAAPSEAGLKQIALRIAAQDWRWADDRQARERQAIAEREGVAISAGALRCASTSEPLAAKFPGQTHLLEPVPRGEACGEAMPFNSVRVECWRLRFDAAGEQLSAKRILEACATRQEARP